MVDSSQKVKICIVGEAYGENEERECLPFVGYTGKELTRMLNDAGIERHECLLTNVFNLRPNSRNEIEALCGPKSAALPGYPALGSGKYIRGEFAGELERLGNELMEADPNLIVAAGNTPMWALLGRTGISKFRGTTDLSTHTVSGFKVLSTYHPSAVCRDWSLRPIVVLDLLKAKRESEFPELRRPQREIWIEPTIEDLHEFERRYINGCTLLSVDIETIGNQITCIGFAPSHDTSLVIPFLDPRRKDRSYWPTPEAELEAWEFVRVLLERRDIRKLFQNGLYDLAFIWRTTGIKVFGASEDSMLAHHALQPESLKGLGFLASVYCSEGPWKHMREKAGTTIKRDD